MKQNLELGQILRARVFDRKIATMSKSLTGIHKMKHN